MALIQHLHTGGYACPFDMDAIEGFYQQYEDWAVANFDEFRAHQNDREGLVYLPAHLYAEFLAARDQGKKKK